MRRLRRRRIQEGLTAPSKQPGRPLTAQVRRATFEFEEKIRANPVRSVRQLAKESGISASTGLQILRRLGYASRTRLRQQKLTDANKERRVLGAKKIINLLKNKPRNALVFASDEAWIDTDPFRNTRVIQVICATGAGAEQEQQELEDADRFQERVQRAPGRMVWGVCASNGSSELQVCERGVKIDSAAYQGLLEPHFDWLRQNFAPDELRGALWLQDSAPAHASTSTQDFLRQRLGELGIR